MLLTLPSSVLTFDKRPSDNKNSVFGLRTKLGIEATLAKGLTFNTYFLYDKMKATNRQLVNEYSSTARTLLNRYASLDANGKALFGAQGRFRLVVPKDKPGARSVRMLTKIEVVQLRK